MHKVSLAILALIASVLLSGISEAMEKQTAIVRTFVSILPQAYLVERIGTPYVVVQVLVGPGQSPATYEPTPKQMAELARSHVYFRIGVPFEHALMPKIAATFEKLSIVDTRDGITLRFFGHHHGSEAPDPHIWLDPKLAKIQARTIYDALRTIDRSHGQTYDNNLRTLQTDLDILDQKITTMLGPLKGKELFVFHPAFGYFADSYGLLRRPAVRAEGQGPRLCAYYCSLALGPWPCYLTKHGPAAE